MNSYGYSMPQTPPHTPVGSSVSPHSSSHHRRFSPTHSREQSDGPHLHYSPSPYDSFALKDTSLVGISDSSPNLTGDTPRADPSSKPTASLPQPHSSTPAGGAEAPRARSRSRSPPSVVPAPASRDARLRELEQDWLLSPPPTSAATARGRDGSNGGARRSEMTDGNRRGSGSDSGRRHSSSMTTLPPLKRPSATTSSQPSSPSKVDTIVGVTPRGGMSSGRPSSPTGSNGDGKQNPCDAAYLEEYHVPSLMNRLNRYALDQMTQEQQFTDILDQLQRQLEHQDTPSPPPPDEGKSPRGPTGAKSSVRTSTPPPKTSPRKDGGGAASTAKKASTTNESPSKSQKPSPPAPPPSAGAGSKGAEQRSPQKPRSPPQSATGTANAKSVPAGAVPMLDPPLDVMMMEEEVAQKAADDAAKAKANTTQSAPATATTAPAIPGPPPMMSNVEEQQPARPGVLSRGIGRRSRLSSLSGNNLPSPTAGSLNVQGGTAEKEKAKPKTNASSPPKGKSSAPTTQTTASTSTTAKGQVARGQQQQQPSSILQGTASSAKAAAATGQPTVTLVTPSPGAEASSGSGGTTNGSSSGGGGVSAGSGGSAGANTPAPLVLPPRIPKPPSSAPPSALPRHGSLSMSGTGEEEMLTPTTTSMTVPLTEFQPSSNPRPQRRLPLSVTSRQSGGRGSGLPPNRLRSNGSTMLDDCSRSDLSTIMSMWSTDMTDLLADFRVAKDECLGVEQRAVKLSELCEILSRVTTPLPNVELLYDLFRELAAQSQGSTTPANSFANLPLSIAGLATPSNPNSRTLRARKSDLASTSNANGGAGGAGGANGPSGTSANGAKHAAIASQEGAAVAPRGEHGAGEGFGDTIHRPISHINDGSAAGAAAAAAAAANGDHTSNSEDGSGGGGVTVLFETFLARMVSRIYGSYPFEVVRSAFYFMIWDNVTPGQLPVQLQLSWGITGGSDERVSQRNRDGTRTVTFEEPPESSAAAAGTTAGAATTTPGLQRATSMESFAASDGTTTLASTLTTGGHLFPSTARIALRFLLTQGVQTYLGMRAFTLAERQHALRYAHIPDTDMDRPCNVNEFVSLVTSLNMIENGFRHGGHATVHHTPVQQNIINGGATSAASKDDKKVVPPPPAPPVTQRR